MGLRSSLLLDPTLPPWWGHFHSFFLLFLPFPFPSLLFLPFPFISFLQCNFIPLPFHSLPSCLSILLSMLAICLLHPPGHFSFVSFFLPLFNFFLSPSFFSVVPCCANRSICLKPFLKASSPVSYAFETTSAAAIGLLSF